MHLHGRGDCRHARARRWNDFCTACKAESNMSTRKAPGVFRVHPSANKAHQRSPISAAFTSGALCGCQTTIASRLLHAHGVQTGLHAACKTIKELLGGIRDRNHRVRIG